MSVTTATAKLARTSAMIMTAVALNLATPSSARSEEMVLNQFVWDDASTFVFNQKLRTSGAPDTTDWSNWFMASNRGFGNGFTDGTRLFVADSGGGINEFRFDGTHFAFEATLNGGSPVDGEWTGGWQDLNESFPGLQTYSSDGAGTFSQQVYIGVGFTPVSGNTFELRGVVPTSDVSNTEMWWANGEAEFSHTGHQFFALHNGSTNGTNVSLDRYINGFGDGVEPDLFADYEDTLTTSGEPGDSAWDQGFGTFFATGPSNRQLFSLSEVPELGSSNGDLKNKSTDGCVTITGIHEGVSTTVDWGDGSAPEAVNGNAATDTFTATHNYSAGGIYTITVSVDDGTNVTTKTTQAVVQGISLVGDTLYIVGTDGRDKIELDHNQFSNRLKVKARLDRDGENIRVKKTLAASDVSQVVSFLCDGDDHYHVKERGWYCWWFTNSSTVNHTVFGHGGNDHLQGGGGSDALFGGLGCDYIEGDRGNDILVGGDHGDVAWSYTGDSLIIGGILNELDDCDPEVTNIVNAALEELANNGDPLAVLGNVEDDFLTDYLFGGWGQSEIIGGVGDWVCW